jgi:hypothetical protein
MASNAKRKTTMAKLNRESKLREKRLEKQARKEARKLAQSQEGPGDADASIGDATEVAREASAGLAQP